MSDEEKQDIPMGECGACQAIVPLDSESCPNCGVNFGGISEEQLGECGACGTLQPIDSVSCINCGVSFVEEEPETHAPAQTVPEVEHPEHEEQIIDIPIADANEILSGEHEIVEDGPEEEHAETETEVDEALEEVFDDEEVLAETETEVDEALEEVFDDEEELAETETEVDEALEEESDEDSQTGTESEISAEVEEELQENSDDGTESDLEDDSVEETEADLDTQVDEDEKNMNYWRSTVVMAFENLALAIAESGMTASEAFVAVDGNDDKLIDAPELQKGIEEISGEWLSASQIKAILEYLDTNENNRIDPNELVEALDNLKIGIKPGKFPKSKKVKEFPSRAQKFLMGKSANDIFYPVAYFFMITIIGLFIANGFAIPGASGEGGNVVYEGDGENWNHCGTEIGDSLGDTCSGFVNDGEIYPCEASIDPNECRNSITIFSGESGENGALNSMPKGFYLDGIMFITLGLIGLGATAYLHLVYAPSLRQRVKGDDNSVEESTEAEEDTEDDEDEGILDSPKDLEIESQYDDETDEDEESEEVEDSEEDDDEESEDDDIDIGDWVGIEIDGEEFYGEIVEFDDDEGTVTIETEDGDEVTGDQDEMFLEDEDDE